MKLFTVKKGTGATLCTPADKMTVRVNTDGSIKNEAEPWTTRKDLILTREELLVDLISLKDMDTYSLCKELEQKGYGNNAINAVMNNCRKCMVFEKDDYILIVDANCVQTV